VFFKFEFRVAGAGNITDYLETPPQPQFRTPAPALYALVFFLVFPSEGLPIAISTS
jgi:hypothetical protein